MTIRATTLPGLSEAFHKMDEYYADVRALFEFIDIRFRLKEYGVRLASLGGDQLHSNASGYAVADDSAYPFYLWTPSWLGRFFIDQDAVPAGLEVDECPASSVECIGFVWLWMGLGDAYVKDAEDQECWVGVAETECDSPDRPIREVADMMWKFFRVESTATGEDKAWLLGQFHANEIGCTLTGRWFLKRIPMRELTSFYTVNRHIVQPLSEKYFELTQEQGEARRLVAVPLAPGADIARAATPRAAQGVGG